jgi:hypothetical protein
MNGGRGRQRRRQKKAKLVELDERLEEQKLDARRNKIISNLMMERSQ